MADIDMTVSAVDAKHIKNRAYQAAWARAKRASDPEFKEKDRQRALAWKHANRAKVNAYACQYHKANREKCNAYNLAYKAAHKAEIAADKAAWRAANLDRAKANIAAWFAVNPGAARVHSQNRRARIKAQGGRHTAGDVQDILKRQKQQCAYCRTKMKSYCVDHIMPLKLGGSNDRINLQLLCRHCNAKKSAKHPVDYARQIGLLI